MESLIQVSNGMTASSLLHFYFLLLGASLLASRTRTGRNRRKVRFLIIFLSSLLVPTTVEEKLSYKRGEERQEKP